ncbi:MAG: DUF1289 domain-containing protein [Gammaproteobacteria bacterium]|nr:DUF1289 domain-containing protein [Gammaproteobacteria bacterium]MYD75940.1 DUF1289 domain-containing protein [Gammaproteobacteria bacterium]MYJ52324.1 DUF1289 domain-containing protein [Gammaproteobacteria bacterium]
MSATPRARRQNRRRSGRTVRRFDTSVPSPCLSVCTFDGEPFCRGCYRNADEIRDWMIMSREQKLAVLEQVAERRRTETGVNFW